MIVPTFGLSHKVAAIGVLCALSAVVGAWSGHKLTKNYYVAKEAERAKAEALEITRLNKIAYELGQALAAETRKRQDQARAHRAEIAKWGKHGTVEVVCQQGSGIRSISPDAVRFGADYVDLWNAGLRLGLPAAAGPGRPDDATKRTDPPTATDLLANVADNAEACNADRARLKKLQQYLMQLVG